MIEGLELELTIFNAKRALTSNEKLLVVKKIGATTLLLDTKSPNSIYYNRIKGFGMDDLPYLDQILDTYSKHDLVPCFDLSPSNLNGEVAQALAKHGYVNMEQLAFLQLTLCQGIKTKSAIPIVKVTAENAKEYVQTIISSNGGMDIDDEVIERKKHYFHQPNFHNYMAYQSDEVAGIGSLFLRGDHAYIANDYTFEQFRGKGVQKGLLTERIKEAMGLGISQIFTDVEFGSISHGNLEKLGFKTVFLNSFWQKEK